VSRKQQSGTELELRVEFARRRDEREQRQARSLCAVDSDHCRAGDEWEWFDLVDAPRARTFCFCPAHALAAELTSTGGVFFDAPSGPQIIAKIHELERKRGDDRKAADSV
jgi:hypothetical protein